MIAQTDDAALRLKDVWKGNDSFTIPFDARYGAWFAGVVLSSVATIGAWQVTRAFRAGGAPGGLLLTALVLTVCGAAALAVRARVPGKPAWIGPLSLAPLLVLTFLPVATSGGPAGSLLSLASAVVVGVGGSVLLVRGVGRHIDAVTPLRYQVAVFRAESRAPRPVPPVARAAAGPVHIEIVDMLARSAVGPVIVPAPPAQDVAHTVTGPRPI